MYMFRYFTIFLIVIFLINRECYSLLREIWTGWSQFSAELRASGSMWPGIFMMILLTVFLVDSVKKLIYTFNTFSFFIIYIHYIYFICIYFSQTEIQIFEKNQRCDLLIFNILTGIWGWSYLEITSLVTSKFKTRLLMESSCWSNENEMVKLWTEVCCGVCWACCLICRWVQQTLLIIAMFRNSLDFSNSCVGQK